MLGKVKRHPKPEPHHARLTVIRPRRHSLHFRPAFTSTTIDKLSFDGLIVIMFWSKYRRQFVSLTNLFLIIISLGESVAQEVWKAKVQHDGAWSPNGWVTVTY